MLWFSPDETLDNQLGQQTNKMNIKTVKVDNNQYGVAFFEGNRVINPNNVKKKKDSLKDYGNLSPLTYINGDSEGLQGKKIVDAFDGTEIQDADKAQYIVVVDGQHRITAAKELAEANEFDLDSLVWTKVELPEGKTVEDVVIEMNTVVQKWKGNDYIAEYALRNPENEIAKFAQMLAKEGISSKTINKYIFFNERFSWAKVNEEALKKADVERATEIWKVVETFPSKVKKSSVIIDYIMNAGGNNHWKVELDKVSNLTDENKDHLDKLKAKDVRSEFEKLMND